MVEEYIFLIRGHRVMLSAHLAELYGVAVKVLIQAVKRNKDRFPEDFMFQLTWDEAKSLRSQFVILKNPGIVRSRSQFVTLENAGLNSSRSQIVILKKGRNIKYLPYAFTEQGVAMLSSVLNSKRAVQVNIAIMRAFVKIREILSTNKELANKLSELERKIEKHDKEIQAIFDAIRQLMAIPEKPKREIGFHSK